MERAVAGAARRLGLAPAPTPAVVPILTLAVVLAVVPAGCTTEPSESSVEGHRAPSASTSPSPTARSSGASPSSPSSAASPSPAPPPRPPAPRRFQVPAAVDDVRLLAGRIGPRLATGPAFRRAGDAVTRRLEDLGYDVVRQSFPVPAGDSWGVPVRAGTSFNVVATLPGFDHREPHVVVGAHLDTVAVAPGAEDNASGVSVLLELARLGSTGATRLPVAFVAFGAEEPRGPGDDQHHFGSRHYVRQMGARSRETLRAMVSLDRVGVGSVVPVCTGPLSPPVVQRQLVVTARRIGVPAETCENTASDHWSFERAGFAVARLGSTPYAAYHSPADRPGVVDPRQLARVGRLAWAWLSRPGTDPQPR